MKGRLLAFGCSYTYGHGLSDCFIPISGKAGPNPSKHAWPAHLANTLGRTYRNVSHPGASNKHIWHEVVSTEYKPDDIVIISWSHPDRWIIIKDDHPVNSFIGPWMQDKISKTFYKKFYDSRDMNVDFNLRMHHAKLYLDSVGVKNYHLVQTSEHIDQLEWNSVELLTPKFFDIFVSLPASQDGYHPNEQAHKKYADEIYKEIAEDL